MYTEANLENERLLAILRNEISKSNDSRYPFQQDDLINNRLLDIIRKEISNADNRRYYFSQDVSLNNKMLDILRNEISKSATYQYPVNQDYRLLRMLKNSLVNNDYTYNSGLISNPLKPSFTFENGKVKILTDQGMFKQKATSLINATQFAVKSFVSNSNSTREICKKNGFGTAENLISCMAVKIFNSKVIPGLLLHGCTYLEVKQKVKVHAILITGKGNLPEQGLSNIQIENENKSVSFSNRVVVDASPGVSRDYSKYTQQLKNIDGEDIEKQLNLPLNLLANDDQLKPFGGPIILPPGTYAIPFCIRIPPELNQTISYIKSSKKDEPINLLNLCVIDSSVTLESMTNSQQATVCTDQLLLFIHSGASLPPIVNGAYKPGYAELFNIKYKDSKLLLILEKQNLKLEDTIKIYLYSNNKKAVDDAFVDLIQINTLNVPNRNVKIDIKGDVKRPHMLMLAKSEKYDFKNSVSKTFTSNVSSLYPAGVHMTNSTVLYDDLILLPESDRIIGCIIELKIPKVMEPSYTNGEEKIEYYLRVHLDVHRKSRTVVETVQLTLAEELYHNYAN